MSDRQPMTPREFDAACRALEHACPFLRQTSGYRNAEHNRRVGGAPQSKHLIAMARDYSADSLEDLYEAMGVARRLGMWVAVHDKGSGMHFHGQGLPPGEIADWWRAKYLSAA